MKRWTKAQTLEHAEVFWRMKPGPRTGNPQLLAWALLFEWAAMR